MIRIRTRALDATDTECRRIRATSSTGATLTVPYDYTSPEPHKDVAERLHGGPVTFVEHTDTEYRFTAEG